MKKHDSYIEDIIGKILSEETITSNEQKTFDQWLLENEENRKYFEHLQIIFTGSVSLKNTQPVNTDMAWEKLQHKMKDATPQEAAKIISINYFVRVAALFLVIFGLGIVLYFLSNNTSKPVTVASADAAREVKLPDSSSIFLNKNSSITYTFSKNKRQVELKGEAYFEVTHDEKQPFIVNVGDLKVEDIGTAFNIKTNPEKNTIDVLVESGEVALTAPDQTVVHLTQGERSVYDQTSKTISKAKLQNANELSYKTKIFVFENASLEVAVQKLNEVYGTNITLSESIKSCHITSTFKNEKIGSIIDIIGETLHLKVTRKEDQIMLEGEGCE